MAYMYVVGYKKKDATKEDKWNVVGMPFTKKPSKAYLKRLGFEYMWKDGNIFKIQKLKKVI
jgi:hypothetical protein